MPHTIPACTQCGLECMYPGGDSLVRPDSAGNGPKAVTSAMLLKSALLKKA